MNGLQIALFVEGTTTSPSSSSRHALEAVWNELLPGFLGTRSFVRIFGISKCVLIAMDPANPPRSGNGEAFDALLARMLKRYPFDAALVAWDLHPKWNGMDRYCRWEETLNLYRFLAQSRDADLPQVWKEKARQRYEELASRAEPDARVRVPHLEKGMVLPLCMYPMFEALITQDESAAKRAFEIAGSDVPRTWPGRGWGDPHERRPDANVLTPAVNAVKGMTNPPACARHIRGDMRTKKDEWGEYLLRQMINDEESHDLIRNHPICQRFLELLN